MQYSVDHAGKMHTCMLCGSLNLFQLHFIAGRRCVSMSHGKAFFRPEKADHLIKLPMHFNTLHLI